MKIKQKVLYAVSSIVRTVFAKEYMQHLNLLLYHVALRGMGILNYENSEVSGENNLLKQLTKTKIKTIIEVGAHDGSDSVQMAKLFPKATIHSFEPHLGNFAKLKKNTSFHSRIIAVNKGLGSAESLMTIWDHNNLPKGTQHASLHKDVISQLHGVKPKGTKVRITTLDKYSRSKAIKQINFLKIDTEGHELEVLRGARRLLLADKISYIQFEFNNLHALSKVFFKDIMDELNGFAFYRLLPQGFTKLNNYDPLTYEIFAFQNILAIAPGRKDITK